MITKTLARLALLVVPIALAAGCIPRTSLCEATRPLTPGEFVELGQTSASTGGGTFYLLFIPFNFGNHGDMARDARDEAIRALQGDALVNVTTTFFAGGIPFPILGFKYFVTKVEGQAVRITKKQ